ncbi:MAG: tyrosine-type recombinase/integrase [Prevotella sp.]|nr:tyrosine-type recombinase/integrase [Prevotella sp.]
MAKQLYDHWFVQFDFPNEEGKPYKSCGGKMVWNDKLKREIPDGWYCGTLLDIAQYTNGLACQKFRPIDDNKLPVIKIKEMHDGISSETEFVKSDIPESVKVYDGDVLFSWSASLEVMLWAYGNGGLNQHIFKVTSNNGYPRSFYFYQLIDYIGNFKRMAEARKTTMGHITQDHLKQSTIALPPNTNIANKLEERLSPIFDAIINNSQEIMNLTKQRDNLLPLLMNGQVSVNYHLYASFYIDSLILSMTLIQEYMKEMFFKAISSRIESLFTEEQACAVLVIVKEELSKYEISKRASDEEVRMRDNSQLVGVFLSAKRIEGCSEKTIHYYQSSIEKLLNAIDKGICEITTNDIRCYLATQQESRQLSKVTIDNLRRIFSSFFSWLEDEDYITKSPVRRIHKVRTDTLVKEVLSDESMEILRDSCTEIRDIAMIDILASTGIRVGELVKMNRDDIDFQERQCVVFGKGNKEREVYFNARTKIHLKRYLEQRTDSNPALFVGLSSPYTRLSISGVESRLRLLGKRTNILKVHPHKFRRTLATMAIDKGMPIEQVQKLLGHVKIDTTLHYAMVNQTNVKLAHRKYLG